jgi:hypothetical protein
LFPKVKIFCIFQHFKSLSSKAINVNLK